MPGLLAWLVACEDKFTPLRPLVAKNQNTIEKRRREMEKKRKADEKRDRRRKKKEAADAPPTPASLPAVDSPEDP